MGINNFLSPHKTFSCILCWNYSRHLFPISCMFFSCIEKLLIFFFCPLITHIFSICNLSLERLSFYNMYCSSLSYNHIIIFWFCIWSEFTKVLYFITNLLPHFLQKAFFIWFLKWGYRGRRFIISDSYNFIRWLFWLIITPDEWATLSSFMHHTSFFLFFSSNNIF